MSTTGSPAAANATPSPRHLRAAPSEAPWQRLDHEPSERGRARMTARLLERIAACDDLTEIEHLQGWVAEINMGVARAIASRYHDRGIAREDLVQAAYVGLVKAAQGFDPAFDRDFLSYAVPTITGEVKRYFRDQGWVVRPPRRVQELQAQISRAGNELSQELHRAPTATELARALATDVDSVVEALAADGCFTPASLDVPVGEEANVSLGELLGEDDAGLRRAEARVILAPAVRALGDRDRRIVELRFFHGWTQEQIARDIGVTQMQVSRLLARILADLRQELC